MLWQISKPTSYWKASQHQDEPTKLGATGTNHVYRPFYVSESRSIAIYVTSNHLCYVVLLPAPKSITKEMLFTRDSTSMYLGSFLEYWCHRSR